ncbi:hypothetical protein FB451DRAFT_673544 [Mycena latifolia]|nr:hypothetical protein FB451DRAFT_673544 [Mycena latifolia]
MPLASFLPRLPFHELYLPLCPLFPSPRRSPCPPPFFLPASSSLGPYSGIQLPHRPRTRRHPRHQRRSNAPPADLVLVSAHRLPIIFALRLAALIRAPAVRARDGAHQEQGWAVLVVRQQLAARKQEQYRRGPRRKYRLRARARLGGAAFFEARPRRDCLRSGGGFVELAELEEEGAVPRSRRLSRSLSPPSRWHCLLLDTLPHLYSGVLASPPHSSSPPPRPLVSLQSASLGRAAAISPVVNAGAASLVVWRERGRVQEMSRTLVSEVQGRLDMRVACPAPATAQGGGEGVEGVIAHLQAPSFQHFFLQSQRAFAATQQAAYKQLASAFYTINSKYSISWECAELLIELGGGSDRLRSGKSKVPFPGPLTGAASAGAFPGPPLASPPSNLAWRVSTRRNDLSQCQLLLLEEMQGSPVPGGLDESFGAEDGIPEEVMAAAVGSTNTVNREWRWDGAMNSAVTLPSEENGV